MKAIWKYALPVQDRVDLEMPKGAKVLTVQTQYEMPTIWALVDPESPKATRRFRIIGTGHDILTSPGNYVGTFQLLHGDLVFHLFELPE